MNDKAPSKAEQVRALREQRVSRNKQASREPSKSFLAKWEAIIKAPNPFEDAARGRDPVPPKQKAKADSAECPVCAARRRKRAMAQKKWRKGKSNASA